MKTLSFVIPVYNEEKRISKTIEALTQGFNYDGVKLEKVIFVDDGSKDATVKLLMEAKESIEKVLHATEVVISYSPNEGKGNAIKVGMAESTSDYTLFFDADMSTPLSEFGKFIPFMQEGADVIVGTRKNGESTVKVHQPFVREYLGKGFTLCSKLILNTWVTDFTCGFKAFSKEAKDAIFPRSLIKRWGYDAELLFLARKLGYKISERAVYWYDDKDTKVSLRKAVLTSFVELLKIRYYEVTGKYHFNKAIKFVTNRKLLRLS